MKREEIISIYSYVVYHLTDDERKKVDKYEHDALYLSLKDSNVNVLEDAIIRIIKVSNQT